VTANLLAHFNGYSRGAVTLMPEWDDQELLDGLRALDSRAIGAVYDRYSPEIFRYARYRLGDERLAEDLAGDVFVHLLEAVQNGTGPRSNIKGWLFSTVSHLVTDHLRRRYRRPTEPLPEDLVDASSTPVDLFDDRERSREFRRAYALLTHEQQHVLALRFGEGFSLEQTAQVLNKNANAVKALQFRALAALQRNIGESANE
jgi:RNA polymerase sigma-70 factor (ECF subfamily)